MKTCARCGHPQIWHSHDDQACLSKHFQPCVPDFAPNRCLGYDCMGEGFPGGTPETRCGCPDFQAEKGASPASGPTGTPETELRKFAERIVNLMRSHDDGTCDCETLSACDETRVVQVEQALRAARLLTGEASAVPPRPAFVAFCEQRKADAYARLDGLSAQVPGQDYERGRATGRVQAFSEMLDRLAGNVQGEASSAPRDYLEVAARHIAAAKRKEQDAPASAAEHERVALVALQLQRIPTYAEVQQSWEASAPAIELRQPHANNEHGNQQTNVLPGYLCDAVGKRGALMVPDVCSSRASDGTTDHLGGPIPLNDWQERAVKQWAADDRLWTTQETVEFNLRTFARSILAAASPLRAPQEDGQAAREFVLALQPDTEACTGDTGTCPVDECILCGERDCPHGEPLHYHHDGCPACWQAEKGGQG